MADVFTKEKRSWVMSRIRSKNTEAERKLMAALKKAGLRFTKYAKNIIGKPDIAFPREKVAVFVDGDFWHGRGWKKLRKKLKKRFWRDKISGNIARDKVVNKTLRRQGWLVLRLWETDVLKSAMKAVLKVTSKLRRKG